ncbi:hypothetical protein ACIBI4_27675 [Streptomyces sp. NPDC050418]|uniref:hypothetical protein n=1 Tax=Streptomyces sp. NPDC050418 TaxID=3365612 RepID=UPI0037A51917
MAATLVPLATATPAYAVACTHDSGTGNWAAFCSRDGSDSDPGGVSGSAKLSNLRTPDYAQINFKAKGEKFTLINETGYTAIFHAYYYYGEQRYQFFEGVRVGAFQKQKINKTLSENRRVYVMACVQERGCAAISTLRS